MYEIFNTNKWSREMLSAWKRLLGGQTDGVPNTADVTRLGPLDNQDPQPIRIQVQLPAQPTEFGQSDTTANQISGQETWKASVRTGQAS
jgi:hypothetical protein